MSELNVGFINIASLAVSLIMLVVGLVLWFFVNRVSSRANEQVELLEALLDQHKRQNALLRRLCEANEPKAEKIAAEVTAKENDADDFSHLVAER